MSHTSPVMFLLLLVPTAAASSSTSVTSPNFVVFFADDFGWGDLHSYGHPTQEKGRIDEMAENGIRFTQWYSAESVCTPSRMAMMTGRMPTRMGMPHTVFSPASSNALPLDEATIAEVLRPKGYATGMVGKWHLGINQADNSDGLHLPFYRGFETVGRILPFSNHWNCDESGRHEAAPDPAVCFIYHNTTLVQQPIDHRNLTATLVADAVSFITTSVQQQRPFYFYFPFPQCHVSMFTDTKWTNTSVNGIFGDQIREMDWAVGQVLDTLAAVGADKNTLVFFTSDHGPHVELCNEGGTTSSLRGGKGDSSWEGGVRVPGIAYWPGTISPTVTDAVVSTMDIFATLVDLSGASVAADKPLDGRSLVPLLTAKNSSSPHEALFHYCGDNLMAVRVGDFKLRYYTEQLPLDNYSTVHCTAGWAHGEFFQGGWTCKGGSVTTNVIPELFHITSDPSERFPLLDNSTWAAHIARARLMKTLPALPYYDEIPLPVSTSGVCANQTLTFLNHTSLAGYTGQALVDNSSLSSMIAECHARCCNDTNCAAFVVQPDSLNRGKPPGMCKVGGPCCWLVDEADARTTNEPCATCVSAVMPTPTPTGPYADLLMKIDAIVAKHLAGMTRGTIPGRMDKALGPCCHNPNKPGDCTCNYPSQHIP